MWSDDTPLDDPLRLERIRAELSVPIVGRQLRLYHTVTSTNDIARDLANDGAPEGTVVLAEAQSAGRGRGAASSFSPRGVNFYASVVLRPAIRPSESTLFAFIAPLAVADAIRPLGLQPAIKWPNNVLVHGKKVAGVRAEVRTSGEVVDHAVLGVGVNLNVTEAALRQALGSAGRAAASLADLLGRPVDRNAFAADFLETLDAWLHIHRERGATAVLEAWRGLDVVIGRRVEVRAGTTILEGRARRVNPDGHLEVEASDRVHVVVAGEVRLLD